MKKLRRLLRLRNSAGFTLVEVVVSCALLGILILGIMSFVTPILRSVRDKEKDARATMLAQSINTYIGSTIQYAYFVCTVSNCAKEDTLGANPMVTSVKYTGSEFATSKANKGLETLKTCFNTMNSAKPDTFEIRCIGVRWLPDYDDRQYKLMITNEKVNQNTLALEGTPRAVFEDCFYNGMYPVVHFGNYDNQYYVNDDSGTKVPQVKDEDVDMAAALEIVTQVYTDMDCYNIVADKRTNAWQAVENVGFVGFSNIRSNYINKGDYEVIPNIDAQLYSEAMAKDTSVVFSEDGDTWYYYPESFIYYIVRKTKVDTTTTP